jgi:hypothetical protein
MLGDAGLRSFLAGQGDLDIEDLIDRVYALGQDYSGRRDYEDDFTLLGLEVV